MGSYLRPATLPEALAALAGRPRTILAGGTDHFPGRVIESRDEDILDIEGIGLRAIERRADIWRLSCAATWTQIVEAGLPQQFDGLVAAARTVGGPQIQNAGTVVGNVCNASPAADSVPCLLALDAQVELSSLHETRVIPLDAFLLGPRQTARRPDELVTALLIPAMESCDCSAFYKLGARSYLVISIAMVAVQARLSTEGTIEHIRIAFGACSPVAQRLRSLEQALSGRRPDFRIVDPAHLSELVPIDDVRASASYRRSAALELVRRAVADIAAPTATRRAAAA